MKKCFVILFLLFVNIQLIYSQEEPSYTEPEDQAMELVAYPEIPPYEEPNYTLLSLGLILSVFAFICAREYKKDTLPCDKDNYYIPLAILSISSSVIALFFIVFSRSLGL